MYSIRCFNIMQINLLLEVDNANKDVDDLILINNANEK